VELARATGGRLLVVHVLAAPVVLPETYLSAKVYEDLARSIRAEAQRRLDRLLVRASGAGARVSGRLVDGVPVHEQIVRAARGARAGLIVMGTHGRGSWGRLVLGSVANRVLTTAPCPVLTVRGGLRS
jgi:nucleotide-binding universal stress UspA family protein